MSAKAGATTAASYRPLQFRGLRGKDWLRAVLLVLRQLDFFGACNDGSVSEAVKGSFNNMRIIVSVGWSIYPLGYFFGVLTSGVDAVTFDVLFIIANFVHKIGFVLSC